MNITSGLQQVLLSAKDAVALTGAGISAESGIPTFRGPEGLWSKLNPEELANFDAFLRNPELVSQWYEHRRQITRESKPNPAHYALVEMERSFRKFTVVTQNIDNLHTRAGSHKVAELHGNIERNYCIRCGKRYDGDAFDRNGSMKCGDCGGLIRPDIVWFGEMLPADQWSIAENASVEADIMFVVGTSAVVYPAAELPMTLKRHGGKIIEINTEKTPLTAFADFSFQGAASQILPDLAQKIKELHQVAKDTE